MLGLAEARGLYAQRFPKDSWEVAGTSGKILRTNGSLDSHSVSLCATPPLPTHLYMGCSCRLHGPCTLCSGILSSPMGFHLAESIIFKLELLPVPSAPGTEQSPLLTEDPVLRQWEMPTKPRLTSWLRVLRTC